MSNHTTGSVMVIGGGIAGIQSALDLADAGFLVHLVEKSPAIGGVMSALDKTFPTNDCSMCILSPKLVEVGRHRNIRLHTCTDVEAVDGEPGNFSVTLNKSPRLIDLDACTACGDCAAVCPVTRPNAFDMGLSVRKAVYKPYAQAIPSGFAVEKLDKAPCRAACPAHINVQGYVQMVKEGKYREAIEIIMRDLPFPGILGRVCPHACEKSCRRLEVDEAISIRELKRVAADHTNLNDIPVPEIEKRDEKVAIIGSGPAGLTAAYFLAQDGYQVSVYEAMAEPGGMMRYGIPEHRLPRSVLDAEIANLKRYGIEIHTNTAIGKDLTIEDLQTHGAKAVFLATGAWKGLKLRIQGEEAAGVADVTSFLRDVHLGNLKKITGKAVIIGGGHSALDGARVALRLGADESHILYRRSKTEMLAEPEEIEEAEKEGVKIHFLAAPVKINHENGVATEIECIRTRLTEPDTTGRRKPVPIEGSEFTIAAGHIIPAIGQEPGLDFLGDKPNLEVSKWNLLVVNPETLQTNIDGVFAGGDVITGPATVIEAVEAGKRAAGYMAKYLQGEGLPQQWQDEPPMGTNWVEIPDDEPVKHRLKAPTLPVAKRLSGFKEVNLLADQQSTREEASRCINCGGCCECYQCVTACKAHAVTPDTHAQQVETLSIDVGAVIMTPGFESFDPGAMDIYGYGILPNVVTAREFERILSASGPFEGHLVRPSDKKPPEKIAWLQCVGSRNIRENAHGYCSGVCCMYAIKEAVIAKEHAGGNLDTAIFFMDMRTHGKGFEQTYNRAKEEQGVRFIRARFHSIEPVRGTDNLKLTYFTDEGELKDEIFSMVVLSTGLEIPKNLQALAQRLGVEIDSDGFASTNCLTPVATSRPGIFAAGAFSGPKDIPQSVMEASAASSVATALLSSSRNTLTREKSLPDQQEVTGLEPRIGVFVCHCGTNIAGVVDVPGVVKYAAGLPNVVFTSDTLFTCSQDSQENIRKAIFEHGLNRVVVAACTPRTHEPLFQETIQEAGLNPYLFEFANIRDQNAWVHQGDHESATQKAKDLVRMAAARAALLEPISAIQVDVNHDALVIGAGIAGMSAALNLADQGFKTYLVERHPEMGGQALIQARDTWQRDDVTVFLSDLKDRVMSHKQIEVFLESEIRAIDGFVGNFTTSIRSPKGDLELRHGAVILATGGRPLTPDEYLYGKNGRVMKWHELEAMFEANPERLNETRAVAFIQCVGSREPARPYCSKICCTASVKSAIALKEKRPDLIVYILYRDMRTFGQREELYKKAREMGVIFIRYEADEKPVVEKDNDQGLLITVKDHVLKMPLQIAVDYLNLATAIIPAEGQKQLAQMLKVPLNDEGFYMEAHIKLRPVDFATDGVYVAGLAHYPKPIEESIAQAQAAAGRAALLLNKTAIRIEPIVSMVDEEKCIGCGLCEASCAFGAIRLKQVPGKGYRAENYSALCKGCGVCAAGCPQMAIDMKHFRNSQILAAVHAGGAGA